MNNKIKRQWKIKANGAKVIKLYTRNKTMDLLLKVGSLIVYRLEIKFVEKRECVKTVGFNDKTVF